MSLDPINTNCIFSSGLGTSRSLRSTSKLEMGSFNLVDIPPTENYRYPKYTQTDEFHLPKESQQTDAEELASTVKDEATENKDGYKGQGHFFSTKYAKLA